MFAKRNLPLILLVFLVSVNLSGCQAAVRVKAAAPAGTSDVSTPSAVLVAQGKDDSEIPRSPEIPDPSYLNPTDSGQNTSPSEQPLDTVSLPTDESDSNPSPTPPPAGKQTPIHPYFGLNGTPPSAPGLAMRARVFDQEPAKVAYLTFDDGPYPETTPNILKILKDQGVKATFFVLGQQVQQYPDLLKAEYNQGEGIGNHSFTHNYNLIYRSPQAFLAEIRQTEEVINHTIGIRPHIVRAPGGTQGNFHISYYNSLDAADYLVYDWNVSIGDADAPLVPADKLIANLKSQVPGKSRIIVLMHDAGAKLTTVEALPKIIEYLKQQGYTFGVLTPKVAPILFPGGFSN